MAVMLAQAHAQGTLTIPIYSLNGANEVPPNDSTGAAYVIGGGLSLNPDYILSYNISYSALAGSILAGEIHGPAAAGSTGPAIFLLNDNGERFIGTTLALTSIQRDQLYNDLWYVNIFTTAYPMGELRGQLIGSAAVPEPSTWMLSLLGLAAVGWQLRTRRTAS